jgi:transcriptional regulator
MYVPSHFAETRVDTMHRLIGDHPLGTLVTFAAGELNANHIPFEVEADGSAFGTLRAHVARSNPVWRDCSSPVECLTVFQGAQAYVSPSLYPTKQEHGRAVPTYNYMVVHAYGPLQVVDDPLWLRGLLERLTARHEAGRPQPWTLGDAPADYLDKMLGAIVGIEIPITKLIGKWKVSQNQPRVNQVGVEAGMREQGGEDALAMANVIAERMTAR